MILIKFDRGCGILSKEDYQENKIAFETNDFWREGGGFKKMEHWLNGSSERYDEEYWF